MPLARILTHHPERAGALSEQLQQQGYRVEVARPEQTNLAPADLEIEFEICERADALERAASLADELHADVAVAPGVLQMEARPEPAEAAQVSAGPESDREREFEAAFHQVEIPVEHASAEAERPSEIAARTDVPVEAQPQVIEVPVTEPAPLPPVQFLEESPVMKPELVRPPDPVPYLAQLTPFGTPQDHPQTAENTQRFSDQQPPRVAPQKAPGPGMGKRTAQLVGKSIAAMKVGIAETAESFRENLKEYKKRAQVRSAEAHASRVARMLDLEQRQAEAQERAKELEVAREAAAARLAELLRERDPGLREEGLRQEQLREEMLYEASKPVPAVEDASTQRKPLDFLRHASIAGLLRKPRRPMSPQLRAVLTGAAAVTFLFVIGIVLGVLQPRTPLANTANPATTSKGVTVQGGGVTVQTGGGTVKPATPGKSGIAPAAPAGNTPKMQAATPAKPSPRAGAQQSAAQQANEDDGTEDVVVRHLDHPLPPQKPRPQAGQQAGLKHFSDLDN